MLTRNPLPLAQRLALVITSVIVLVLSVSLLLTYRSLARATEEQIATRLGGAAHQLASSASSAAASRLQSVSAIAANDSVVAALEAALIRTALERSANSRYGASRLQRSLANARIVLSRARPAMGDTAPPVELWTREGRRLLHVGRDIPIEPGEARSSSGYPVRRPGFERYTDRDSAVSGALYTADSIGYYWAAAPVRSYGRTLGYVAQQLYVQSPGGALQMMRDLTGEDVRMVMHNNDGTGWIISPGVATEPRVVIDSLGVAPHVASSEGPMVIARDSVEGTPWFALIETPRSVVHERTQRLLASIGFLGILLAALGGIISFFVGRRIARPLVELSDAVEGFAHGDYERRVPVKGHNEVARLATSVNTMAGEVDRAQRALEERFAEARASARQMEAANERLQIAMREAEHAREEAQQANRAKSDFLAVMSHELRTPLNAIGGYAQLLEIGVHGAVNEEQRDALQRIARSQAHLLRLINDVLNFAQIDAGGVRYSMNDVPVDETLGGLEALVAPQLQARRLTLEYVPCGADVTVHADEDKLKQIVLNLLTNAIKFTPEGGRIVIDCESDAERVLVNVHDTGVGIPSERLDTIFDPFVQLDRTVHRSAEGVGLGLAISRDLARGMDGDLTASSVVGSGSTFTLVLRCRPVTALHTDASREATAIHH